MLPGVASIGDAAGGGRGEFTGVFPRGVLSGLLSVARSRFSVEKEWEKNSGIMSLENLLPNQDAAKTPEEGIARLLRILKLLRKQCPWDKKQTFDTLRTLTVEETFELSDAIVDKDYEEIKKEVGDVLLHIAFYAELGEEQGKFDFKDVCNSLCDKLIRRHPHIFGEVEAKTDEEVKKNWEEIKLKEGKKHTVLSGVPSSLPAMIKAYRIQDKARGVGFDWDDRAQVWDKVQEEMGELQAEVRKMDELKAHAPAGDGGEAAGSALRPDVLARQQERVLSELGDVLFALVNYARFVKVNPEDALEHTNRKFIERFTYMEEHTIQKGKSLHDMTLEEMDVYWNEAKRVLGGE